MGVSDGSYVAFTDESNITASRIPSISVFSFPSKYFKELNDELGKILHSSSVDSEFKWQKVRNAKYYYCAEKIIDYITNNLVKFNIRIDCISWDLDDKRHSVKRRDNVKNYKRMFYHLLGDVLKKRKKGCTWHIRPDKRAGINWGQIKKYLQYSGAKRDYSETIFGPILSDPYYSISTFEEQESNESIPIQVADFFSGLSSFSHEKYNNYVVWNEDKEPNLFINSIEYCASNSDEYRFKVLEHFYKKCRNGKLGVSLNTNRYLNTPQHSNPINFWTYKPQGSYDKAPTKVRM